LKKPPRLPQLLDRKIYKTGQTRGADDDEIYQNRVLRESTVLIPYRTWERACAPPPGEKGFTYGYIALVSAEDYFGMEQPEKQLKRHGLTIGSNALVFYETRAQWNNNNPKRLRWKPAERRMGPLGGEYVARVPGNTSEDGEKILHGFTSTTNKGAGIRAYEYASAETIHKCRHQLEALFWMCHDAIEIASTNAMTADDAKIRKDASLELCAKLDLLDTKLLTKARMLNAKGHTVCPLCLEELSALGFLSRVTQAEGREVSDLTITQVNLFHIEELRYGLYNHRPYNLGWGHHHCNVVVKDSGIVQTLEWMQAVLERNAEMKPQSASS
jgi:hypothetical protein